MDIKAIQAAISNANKVTETLANQEKFVEAGVVNALAQVVRVVVNQNQKLQKELDELREKSAVPLKSIPVASDDEPKGA